MKRIIATRLLLVEGASPPDLAIARPVNGERQQVDPIAGLNGPRLASSGDRSR